MGELKKAVAIGRQVALVAVICAGLAAVVVPVVRWVGASLLSQPRFEAIPPLDSFAKYVTMAVLVVGAVAAYIRFFYGRMFVARARPTMSVEVVRSGLGTEELVHLVHLDLENKGTARLRVEWVKLCSFFDGNGSIPQPKLYDTERLAVAEALDTYDYEQRFGDYSRFCPKWPRVIDSGETDSFLFVVPVGVETKWVIHQVRIGCGRHDWRHAVAVANEPTRKEEERKTANQEQ